MYQLFEKLYSPIHLQRFYNNWGKRIKSQKQIKVHKITLLLQLYFLKVFFIKKRHNKVKTGFEYIKVLTMDFFETLNLKLIFFPSFWSLDVSNFFSECVIFFIKGKKILKKNTEAECWPVIYEFYSLSIKVWVSLFLVICRPLNMGCFHLQNDIWKDHYPVPIFATNYLCGKILFVWICFFLFSLRDLD